MFIPLGFMHATSNPGVGFLLDREGSRRVLGVMRIGLDMLLLTVTVVSRVRAVRTYGAVFGLLQDTISTISGSAYDHYVCRKQLGAIKDFANTVLVAGIAIGQLLYGTGFTLLGSCDLPITASAAIPIAIGVTAVTPRPRNHGM